MKGSCSPENARPTAGRFACTQCHHTRAHKAQSWEQCGLAKAQGNQHTHTYTAAAAATTTTTAVHFLHQRTNSEQTARRCNPQSGCGLRRTCGPGESSTGSKLLVSVLLDTVGTYGAFAAVCVCVRARARECAVKQWRKKKVCTKKKKKKKKKKQANEPRAGADTGRTLV